MAKVALITLYNPGCNGLRSVAASLDAAGHEPFIISFKEYRAQEVCSSDTEHLEKLKQNRDVLYVIHHVPGKKLFLPYPTTITDKEKELLIRELRDNIKPDIVGFSFFTVTYEIARQLTNHIKKQIPEMPVIWGGTHCIAAPEQCIRGTDIICTGEGEDAIVELMNQWEKYKREGQLPVHGLWFRTKNSDIIKNPDRDVIHDLDRLPFPLFGKNEILIDDDAVSDKMNKPGPFLNAHVYTFTERGCPYQCSYCIHSILKKHGYTDFRRRSVDNVLEEVKDRVERLGMRHLVFHDEILLINKKWIREFSEKFRKMFHEPYGATFTGYVHPLTTDEEMLDWMVQAGLTKVGMGIQSGSDYISTEVFNRPLVKDKSIKMAQLLGKYEFDIIQYDLLVNNPFEKENDMQETFELLMKFPPPFSPGLFGIVIYEYSKLAERKVPDDPPSDKTNLFYNMLYHLTGISIISRENLRALSENPYLKEHPEELEELAVDLLQAECDLINAKRENSCVKEELLQAQNWIKAHEKEYYSLKTAVKKKVKRILYPLIQK